MKAEGRCEGRKKEGEMVVEVAVASVYGLYVYDWLCQPLVIAGSFVGSDGVRGVLNTLGFFSFNTGEVDGADINMTTAFPGLVAR